MGKRGFLSWLFLGLLVAAPVFLPTSPALAQDCTSPEAVLGSITYNAAYGVFQGCTTAGWMGFHSATLDPTCAGTPNPGRVCSDGTVYAGNSTIAGTPKMFVMPTDNHAGIAWNNTNFLGFVDVPSIPNCTIPWDCLSEDGGDGRAFTDILVNTDANSSVGGHQYHLAAQYCYCLGKGTGDSHCNPDPTGGSESFGYDDWYLPSLSELKIIFENRTVIGGFGTGNYYSSSERDGWAAWNINFNNSIRSSYDKYFAYAVRCVRR